jgi:hypothetical protein
MPVGGRTRPSNPDPGEALKGVPPGRNPKALYEDKASGKRDDRPRLAACLKALLDGDTLLVWRLDRLGRGLPHLVNIVHELTERGVGLKVLSGRVRRMTPPPPREGLDGQQGHERQRTV